MPIASLTKMANAVVILRDHPVAPGADGPMITITADDVSQYHVDLANDESNIPILAGEMLSERQMLEALLTQSANDIAYSLAVWDAGSEPAFVAKMNALAVALGATHTHYVDSSGYLPQSVSTAADCLRIAAAGMAIPTFAEVVGMSTVSLPLVGTAHNIVTEIGTNGVIGVKSGYTSQAVGCMVLAAMVTIEGRSVLVLAAALGQQVPPPVAPTPPTTTATSRRPAPPPTAPPPTTTDHDHHRPRQRSRDPVPAALHRPGGREAARRVRAGDRAGHRGHPRSGRWPRSRSPGAGRTHRAQAGRLGGSLVAGMARPAGDHRDQVGGGAVRRHAGKRVGAAGFVLGSQIQSVPVQLGGALPEPSWWWRLVHA